MGHDLRYNPEKKLLLVTRWKIYWNLKNIQSIDALIFFATTLSFFERAQSLFPATPFANEFLLVHITRAGLICFAKLAISRQKRVSR